MTARELARLVTLRTEANKAMKDCPMPLARLDEEDRHRMEIASATFRETDAAIVAELRKRDRPVTVQIKGRPVELWLMQHRDTFTECDAATGDVIYASKYRPNQTQVKALRYQYPALEAAS